MQCSLGNSKVVGAPAGVGIRRSVVVPKRRSVVTYVAQPMIEPPPQQESSPSNYEFIMCGNSPTSAKNWRTIVSYLQENKLSIVSCQDLQNALNKNMPVIDCRPLPEFQENHISGSINCPLYQPITGWTAWQNLRRAGFAFFGIFNGTELNEQFLREVEEVMGGKKDVIVVCKNGGDASKIDVDRNTYGGQSRSLIAAYELLQKGYNVKIMDGGLLAWTKSGRSLIGVKN